jgi:MoaA/NifB/PqqE/SkfB family radical SAM enzyme
MEHVTAILSMLHERAARSSATRCFRDEPVLAWTLERLSRAKHIGSMAVLCWEDQLEQVTPIAEEHGAYVLSKDPRVIVPALEGITAARNWSDGWRGGLMSTCDFDLGFHAPWVKEIATELSSEAVVLVDPSAGLVDADLIDQIVAHAVEHENVQICFTQAAPGLAGVLLKPSLIDQLAAARTHPGRLLGYVPDQPVRDPTSGDGCVPVPARLARTTRSFKLDTDRQVARLAEASVSLNGELIGSSAEALLHRLSWSGEVDPLPREVVFELTTRRASKPIFSPLHVAQIDREPMSVELAAALFEQLAQADDARVTLAGVGDPLLHPQIIEVIGAARSAGVRAIHVETDLAVADASLIEKLVDSSIDVVSVHLPALSQQAYRDVMGVDNYAKVLENIGRFVTRRHARGRGVPLLVPVFTKLRQNLGEMEAWYDQWLKALGCAVIAGPSDFVGLIPDVAVADMSPPVRRACARLGSRITILSDGRAVSCEQDVLGRHVVGDLTRESLAEVWNDGMRSVRDAHACGQFAASPVCAGCREWHRP